MNILVVGSGGREHALAWKLAQSRHSPRLYFAPGNPGMAAFGQRLEIAVEDIEGLAIFARREKIDLTVVGPEVPLSLGLADRFAEEGLRVFGPVKAGARMESSKAFAKQVMLEAGVPTAGYRFCESETAARSALAEFTPPYVIKQDGLAAGKGVTIAQNRPEAEAALAEAFAQDMPVVIEEFLPGEELSVLAICDGERALPLVGAQDFKKAGDGDTGPNTGGMGAYAPVPFVTPALLARIEAEVLRPTLTALRARGIHYRGVLYAGLMIAPDGTPRVIEFNARFGDPETQVVLPLLEEDLVDLLMAAADGDLSPWAQGVRIAPRAAVTVVLASGGYPGPYAKDKPVTLPAVVPDHTLLFHAGTKILPDQSLVTHGGRVFNATGLGATLAEARARAYALADQVRFENRAFRRDIAERALALLPR